MAWCPVEGANLEWRCECWPLAEERCPAHAGCLQSWQACAIQ